MHKILVCVLVFWTTRILTVAADCASVLSVLSLSSSSALPPQGLVSFEQVESTSCDARVVYWKTSKGMSSALSTPWTPLNETVKAISIFRVSPGLEYQFEVYTRVGLAGSDSCVLNTTATIPVTAWSYLTGRETGEGFVTSQSGSDSAWDLIALDVHATESEPPFTGFVIIDSDGI